MTRREWCTALGRLCSPSFPEDGIKALLVMLPALQHLPNDLFTEATVLEVAGAKRRQSIPAWDEITNALNHYRRTYLPDPSLRRLPPPVEEPRRGPDSEQIAAVAEIVRHCKAELANAGREREMLFPPRFGDGKPLSDVTLKGEVLHRSRVARGLNVPVPGYEPPVPVAEEVAEELEPDPYADSPADAWS